MLMERTSDSKPISANNWQCPNSAVAAVCDRRYNFIILKLGHYRIIPLLAEWNNAIVFSRQTDLTS
jgi:hypothetical protein